MGDRKKHALKIGYVLMILGAVCIAAAIILVVYNRSENARAGSAADDVLPVLQQEIGDSTTDDKDDMSGMLVAGYEYLGYLSIPVLDLELPVMSDWDYTRLKIAPCRYFGSAETDDLVICGHNYDRHFGRLKNLHEGDPVYFTDMDGVTTGYEVVTVEILQPTMTSEMIAGDYDLTLYTCTYGGRSRVTVRCDRVKD